MHTTESQRDLSAQYLCEARQGLFKLQGQSNWGTLYNIWVGSLFYFKGPEIEASKR